MASHESLLDGHSDEGSLKPEENAAEEAHGRAHEEANEASADKKNNDEAEHAQGIVNAQGLVGEHVAENMRAVERRERQQVKDGQEKVEEHGEVEDQSEGKKHR